MERLKILLVDSSVISRMATFEIINDIEYSVVERATSDGSIALEWLNQYVMDIVLLDVAIICKEGLDLIKRIKNKYPEIEIIVMNNHHPESLSITLDALKAGAIDFIQKLPENELGKRKGEIKAQLQTIFTQILLKKYNPIAINEIPTHTIMPLSEQDKNEKSIRISEIKGRIDLILIASSTGGPVALDTIFSSFSTKIHTPVLIVQHMPPDFTKLMAQKLHDKYKLPITEGKNEERITEDKIIIAPGGRHMLVDPSEGISKIIRLTDTGFVNGVRPAADVLFQSVADTYRGKNILVVVLTGMGNDGMKGVFRLKEQCACYCITQSEGTCVVYGMPKCVNEAGLSDEVADLGDIAFRIQQIVLDRGRL